MANKSALVSKAFLDAVILDLDGVITRTAKVHANAWKQVFDEFLLKWSKDNQEPFYPLNIRGDYFQYLDGRPRYDGAQAFLLSRNIHLPFGNPSDLPGDSTVCSIANKKNETFHALIRSGGVEVYEDTIKKVKQWRKSGLRTAVISASKNCNTILGVTGLTGLFDVIVDGIAAEHNNLKGKPAPDIFLFAAASLYVKPSLTAIFEDAIAGVAAGRKGGFRLVIGVSRNDHEEELYKNGADIVISSFDEITDSIFEPRIRMPSEIPSALNEISNIANAVKNKEVLLFLDYDGTLTPIVEKPQDALLSQQMRQLILELMKNSSVAVISGRERTDVENLVNIDSIFYAGSHGMDIRGPGISMSPDTAINSIPLLNKAEKEVRSRLENASGLIVERKKFSVAIHYRLADQDTIDQTDKILDEIVTSLKGLKKTSGKKVFEIRPDIDWDKGKAVKWISKQISKDYPNSIAVYIGDDITDEDAFNELKESGIGILAGSHKHGSSAKYHLADVGQVYVFLSDLNKILKGFK